jgi:hypothetical protein
MYIFTKQRPPLLQQTPDLLSIPPEALRTEVGREKWKNQTVRQRIPSPVEITLRRETRFDLTRYFRWAIFQGPIHYAEDITIDVTETRGYTRSQKDTFERSLEVTVSAAGQPPGFSELKAEVKQGLKITHETFQEWKEEKVTKTSQAFNGAHTYVTWVLVDGFMLAKTGDDIVVLNGVEVERHPWSMSSLFECVIATYQDKAEDKHRLVDRYLQQALPRYLLLDNELFHHYSDDQ